MLYGILKEGYSYALWDTALFLHTDSSTLISFTYNLKKYFETELFFLSRRYVPVIYKVCNFGYRGPPKLFWIWHIPYSIDLTWLLSYEL